MSFGRMGAMGKGFGKQGNASLGGAGPSPGAPLNISGTPPAGTYGSAYSFTPVVTGGSGTKSFTYTGQLPAGLSMNSATGAITGTPTQPLVSIPSTIKVTDSSGNATLGPFVVTVNALSSYFIEDFESLTGMALTNTTGTCVLSADTVNFNTGTQSMKITNNSGASAGAYVTKTYTGSGLTVSADGVISIWLFASDFSKLNGFSLDITIGATLCTKSFAVSSPGKTNAAVKLSAHVSEFTNPGTIVPGAVIASVRYRVTFTAGSAINDFISVDSFRGNQKGRAQIMLAFDLGDTSQVANCLPYLTNYGFKATMFASPGLAGAVNAYAYIGTTAAPWQQLNAAGWDMGNHTYLDTDLTNTTNYPTQANVEAAWTGVQTFFTGIGITGNGWKFASLPLGKVDTREILASTAVGLLMVRGSFGATNVNDFNAKDELSSSQLLPGLSFNGAVTVATANAAVDRTSLHGSKLIDWSHDVQPTPVNGTTVVNWTSHVDYIKAQFDAGLIEVRLMSEVYASLPS